MLFWVGGCVFLPCWSVWCARSFVRSLTHWWVVLAGATTYGLRTYLRLRSLLVAGVTTWMTGGAGDMGDGRVAFFVGVGWLLLLLVLLLLVLLLV